jgi:hypothetical protein
MVKTRLLEIVKTRLLVMVRTHQLVMVRTHLLVKDDVNLAEFLSNTARLERL